MHYKRQWRHGDTDLNLNELVKYAPDQTCSVEGCNKLAKDNGMCSAHGNRVRRHGTPNLVRRANGTGAINAAGYKLITVNGRRVYEHIAVAEKALGKPLPNGAVVHHMNEDPLDNFTPFNLVICPNQAYHLLLHRRTEAAKLIDF
jgi:hypothetical protein